MAGVVALVRSKLPGGSANSALSEMLKEDETRTRGEAAKAGFFSKLCCCTGCSALFKLHDSRIGFQECQDEIDMLTSGLTERDRTQITTNAIRIFRRQRFCGESNYLIATDPTAEGGTKLPIVAILRVSKTASCQTSVRRVCFDARHIIQVEMSDAWETTELALEVIALVFGTISWGYVYGATPTSDTQASVKHNLLVVLFIGNLILVFVILLNTINTRIFRSVQLVVDTCQPGRAMVTNHRFFSEVGMRIENSAGNSAQQYVVTLTSLFAMDARQILQHWKQIGDNLSSQLNLTGADNGPRISPEANTTNLELLLPPWTRNGEAPVADVAEPPPGTDGFEEQQPLFHPPRHPGVMQAAQEQPGLRASLRHKQTAHVQSIRPTDV